MTFKILIEGYAKEIKGEEYATSTTILIADENRRIIVDPGTNRALLLKKLNNENLIPEDIDYVILTHNHLDHSLLTGIFCNARVLDDEFIYSWDSKIINQNNILGNNIEIISTPGHDPFHLSLLLKDTDMGNVVIAGDVFWWWDNEKQKLTKKQLLSKKDPYVKNERQLYDSRTKILDIADYIIPGHGKPFRL